MPWIQHFSRFDISTGQHYDPGTNTILISITDANNSFVTPKYKFVNTAKYQFEDTENKDDWDCITERDAKSIADVLRYQFSQGRNIIVNCEAGLCRASAVAVAGQQIGFTLEDKVRLPNRLVLRMVLEQLGVTPDTSVIKWLDTDRHKNDVYNLLGRRYE